MPSRALTTVPKTYADLRRAVQDAMLRGQRTVEEAKLETYRRTGWLISEHLLLNQDRAEYGAQVVNRLVRDLGVDKTTLYQCVQFVRFFPNLRARGKLGWAHYRALCQVEDHAQRQALVAEAVKHEWTSRQLEERIRPLNAVNVTPGTTAAGAAPKPLTPKRGTPGICRVIADGDALAVDLGFTSYVDLPATAKLREGNFARLDAEGEFAAAGDATKADLYTYRAKTIRVVDGDTLWLKIYLRPGLWLKEKVRLRGLDCPEMDTPEGKAAKRFVEALVNQAVAVTITTTKPDKYDRYLSDVFLKMDSGEDIFLNNVLLANGHAVRKDEYAFKDWEADLGGK